MDTFTNSSGGIGVRFAAVEVTTSYVTKLEDHDILADATAAALTVTGKATSERGQEYRVTKTDSSTNAVTVQDGAGNTLATLTSQNESVVIQKGPRTNVWQAFGNRAISATAVKSSSSTGGIGYATGAGGAVTQITTAATGVTLSKVSGQITTVALTTAAGAEEVFTVTNTTVAATDVVVVATTYAGAGTPLVSVKKVATSAFDIVITNLHSADALDAVVVINFAVIKAVAA